MICTALSAFALALVAESGWAQTAAGPVRTAPPDGQAVFLTVTTTGAANCFAAVGGTFTAADIGKYFVARGMGASAPTTGNPSGELTFTSTIKTVTDAAHICTTAMPPLALSGDGVLAYYGTDQTANLQGAFTAGRASGRGSYVAGGIYLVASPLNCLAPALPWNNTNASPPLCNFDDGATLIYVGSNPTNGALVTFGSAASDYSGFLRNAFVRGGTLDCNFICGYGEFFPFFVHLTREEQLIKNTLWAAVRYGDSLNDPGPSGGIVDLDNKQFRDVVYVAIANITRADPPVVTTGQPHGIATGRFVTIIGANNIPNGQVPTFYAEATDATHLKLHEVNGAGWTAFSGTAQLALALPSYRTPLPFSSATSATPPVVTTSGVNTSIVNGSQIDIWGVTSTGGAYDGPYTACNLTGSGPDGDTQFSLYAPGGCTTPVNGSAITITGAGLLTNHYALVSCTASTQGCPLDAGDYMDGATDAEFTNNTVNAVTVGFYANPASGGYDGKYVANHVWDYPEQGAVLFSHYIGGDNSLIGEQIDCPAWFGPRFTGPRNTVTASEMNCSGFNGLPDEMTTYMRLDDGASAVVFGGRIKGQSSPLARVLLEVSDHSVAGSPAQAGGHPNYQRFNLAESAVALAVGNSGPFGFSGATTSPQSQNTSEYLGVNGAQSMMENTAFLAPSPGVAQSLAIQVDTAPESGQTYTFNVQDNTKSLGGCTVSAAQFSCNATLSGFVNVDDNLAVKSVFSARSGGANVRYRVGFGG